jgi:hypothetical protein
MAIEHTSGLLADIVLNSLNGFRNLYLRRAHQRELLSGIIKHANATLPLGIPAFFRKGETQARHQH